MSYDILFTGVRPCLPAMLREIVAPDLAVPLTVQSLDAGTALTICDETGPVLSVYAPMRVEDESEMERLFPALTERLIVPGFIHEAIIAPRAVELGLVFAQRLAMMIDGQVLALAVEDSDKDEVSSATA